MGDFSKKKIELLYDPPILLLGIYWGKKKNMKMKALIQKELMHPNAHAPQCS